MMRDAYELRPREDNDRFDLFIGCGEHMEPLATNLTREHGLEVIDDLFNLSELLGDHRRNG